MLLVDQVAALCGGAVELLRNGQVATASCSAVECHYLNEFTLGNLGHYSTTADGLCHRFNSSRRLRKLIFATTGERVCFAVCHRLGYTPVSSPGRIFGATRAKQNLEAQRSEETVSQR